MTNSEAIALLSACKPLAERVSAISPDGVPVKFSLTQEDLKVLEGFSRVQTDPIAAGPGLLGRLVKESGLTQVEIYKLEQLSRLVINRRYGKKFLPSEA